LHAYRTQSAYYTENIWVNRFCMGIRGKWKEWFQVGTKSRADPKTTHPVSGLCIIAFAGRYIMWVRRLLDAMRWKRRTVNKTDCRRCYNSLFWYYYYYHHIIITTTTRKTHGRDVSSWLPRPCLFYSVRLTKRFYWIPHHPLEVGIGLPHIIKGPPKQQWRRYNIILYCVRGASIHACNNNDNKLHVCAYYINIRVSEDDCVRAPIVGTNAETTPRVLIYIIIIIIIRAQGGYLFCGHGNTRWPPPTLVYGYVYAPPITWSLTSTAEGIVDVVTARILYTSTPPPQQSHYTER